MSSVKFWAPGRAERLLEECCEMSPECKPKAELSKDLKHGTSLSLRDGTSDVAQVRLMLLECRKSCIGT